ncbi:TetR/AcrR family transcriptional regulator [Pauljensenia sp. 20925_1_34]|uniref:TetR/AcrR family transcriptional regulator n=1 Tax=Pauljensenia sp. 20925_1_34 TaxID=3003674 RepID=UPI00352ED361
MNQAEKSERTREAICIAARQLFADKGYDMTTMQDIVTTSGMSKGAIYHHFSSKQEVLRSVVVGELHYLNAFVEDLAAQSDASVTDRVTVLAKHMVASSPQSGLGRANWVSEVPEALLESLRNTLTKLAPHLEQMLRQGIESGEIGCAFPREVAEVLVLLVDVWVDPLIVAESYERMCQKVDFIAAFLKRFDAQVLSEEAIAVIKNGVGHFYE